MYVWFRRVAPALFCALFLVAGAAKMAAPGDRFVFDGQAFQSESFPALASRGSSVPLAFDAQVHRGELALWTYATSPLRLRTAAVGRGTLVPVPPARSRQVGPTVEQTLPLGLTERFAASPRGVEQSWRLDEPPPGQGDLELHVAAGGLRPLGPDAQGLAFEDPRSGRRVRYGHATFIDAAGRSTPIPSRWENGHIALTVSAQTLEGARYPAVLDPLVEPEQPVDAVAVGPEREEQRRAAVGYDGTNHLVVFSDLRLRHRRALFGVRVAPDGRVLDPAGFAVTLAGLSPDAPAVTFAGGRYLVAWEDGGDIFAARVEPTGAVLDASPIAVSTAAGLQTQVTVAPDASGGFLVAWQDERSGVADIYATRVSAQGAVLDPSGFAVSAATNGQRNPSAAFNGTDVLVAWDDVRLGDRDIYAARVAGNVVRDALGLQVCTALAGSQGYPSVAAEGTGFLVVFEDLSRSDIFAVRVSAQGTVLDSLCGRQLSRGTFEASKPVVASFGGGYWVAWSDGRASTSTQHAYGTRVSPSLNFLDASDHLLGTAGEPSVELGLACQGGGGGCLLAWDLATPTAGRELLFNRIGADGGTGTPAGSSAVQAGNFQGYAAASSSAASHLLVWVDARADVGDVRGARLGLDGQVLDAAALSIGVAQGTQTSPVATFDGQNFLVVWQDLRTGPWSIMGARVKPDGTVLEPGGFLLAAKPTDLITPAVASNGTLSLLAYRSAAAPDQLEALRVDATGAVLDATPLVLASLGDQFGPSVASNGADFLVAWHDRRGSADEVYAARVSAQGALIDPAGFALTSAPGAQTLPATTHGGQAYLVAWQDARAGNDDVYAALVGSDGGVLAPGELGVATSAAPERAPFVAFDGTNYWVGWQRSDGPSALEARRLSTQGVVLDSAPLALADRTAPLAWPVLTSNRDGRGVLAFSRFDPSTAVGAQRLRTRTLFDLANGQACQSHQACRSGTCAQGTCCEGPACVDGGAGGGTGGGAAGGAGGDAGGDGGGQGGEGGGRLRPPKGCGCQSVELSGLALLSLVWTARRRRAWRWGIILLSLASTLAQAEGTADLLREAASQWDNLEFEKAQASYERALAQGGLPRGQLATAHGGLGLCAAVLGRADQAALAFKRALQLDPGYALPANVGPKVRSPYDEARAFWAEQKRPSVELESPRPLVAGKDAELRLYYRPDPLDLGKAFRVRWTSGGKSGELRAREGKLVLLGQLLSVGELVLELDALDRHGSQLAEGSRHTLVVEALPAKSPPSVQVPPTPAPATSTRIVRAHAAVFGLFPSPALGGELGLGLDLHPFDVGAALVLGEPLGLQLFGGYERDVGLGAFRPYGQLRFYVTHAAGQVLGGAGALLGFTVHLGPGRLVAGPAVEGYLGPPGFTPYAVLGLLSYQLDLAQLGGARTP